MLGEKKTVYCPNCKRECEYDVWSGYVHAVIEGRHVGYFELSGLCSNCGRPVSVPEIEEDNRKRREIAYARTEV